MSERNYPGDLTRDEWLHYWDDDGQNHIGDELTLEDVVGDVRFAAREIKRLTHVMQAVGSLAGCNWLIGQLALAEALNGGGPHLDYVFKAYEDMQAHSTAAAPREGSDDANLA